MLVRFIRDRAESATPRDASQPLPCLVITDAYRSDETKQSLNLDLGSAITAEQSTNAPHVYVALRRLTMRLADTSGSHAGGHALRLDVVHPPIPCLDTTSGTLHAIFTAIGGTGSARLFNKEFERLGRCSHWALRLMTVDGASGNERFIAFHVLENKHNPHFILIPLHCFLHQVALIGTSITAALFDEYKTTEQLYIASKFICMGGFFIRILYHLSAYVESNVIILGPSDPRPDAAVLAMWGRVKSAIVSLVRCQHKSSSMYKEFMTVEHPTYLDDLKFMVSILNDTWIPDKAGALIHRCPGLKCCNGPRHTMRKVLAILMRIFFRRKPTPPAFNRWLTMGPACDFWLLLHVTNVASKLLTHARAAIEKRKGAPGESAEDGDWAKDFDWARVAGVRANTTCTWAENPTTTPSLLVFAICLDPIRLMTSWLLRRSQENTGSCESLALWDLQTPRFSPLRRSLQYLRHLLCGPSDRYLAVMVYSGYFVGRREEFITSASPMAHLARRTAFAVHAWLEYRFKSVNKGPLSMARLRDPRLTIPERQAHKANIVSTRLCCADAACMRKVLKTVAVPDDLDRPDMIALQDSISESHLHNGQVECLHRRNQVHNSVQTKVWHLASDFVNSQAVSNTKSSDALWNEQVHCLMPAAPADELRAATPADDEWKDLSGTSPEQVLHQQLLRQYNAMGISVNPVRLWPTVRLKLLDIERNEPERWNALVARANHNKAKPRQGQNAVVDKLCKTTRPRPGDAAQQWVNGHGGTIGSNQYIDSVLGPGFRPTPRIPSDALCQRCGCRGSMHRPAALDVSTVMRRECTAVSSALGAAPFCRHPISADKYGSYCTKTPGGRKMLQRMFKDTACHIGRNLGGIPDSFEAMANCGEVCRRKLKSKGRIALADGLCKLLSSLVAAVGGPKQVSVKQPSGAQLDSNTSTPPVCIIDPTPSSNSQTPGALAGSKHRQAHRHDRNGRTHTVTQ